MRLDEHLVGDSRFEAFGPVVALREAGFRERGCRLVRRFLRGFRVLSPFILDTAGFSVGAVCRVVCGGIRVGGHLARFKGGLCRVCGRLREVDAHVCAVVTCLQVNGGCSGSLARRVVTLRRVRLDGQRHHRTGLHEGFEVVGCTVFIGQPLF
ncbi:hypothetical protein [Chondromyces apiculatus]|uniref:hypothetical protein n=1 Tax=Chondromyces apiculatus TaxID=51 RepID=UPI001E3C1F59|nr:hypothetical protein [Chondromyces apiculatus]